MKTILRSLLFIFCFSPLIALGMAQDLPQAGSVPHSKTNPMNPNCETAVPTSVPAVRRTARQLRAVQDAAKTRGSWNWGGDSGVESIAMRQVSAPLPNVYTKRGRIGLNGYRSSTFQCGAYVRVALQKAGLVRGGLDLTGASPGQAKNFGTGLKANGFRNLCGSGVRAGSPTCGMSPESAPRGSVLVYDYAGCGHRAGHVEIKTSSGYVSDYFSTSPRTGGGGAGNCRRLIGVWIK